MTQTAIEPMKVTGLGSVEGYAATWVKGADGIRYAKGCFAKSISERMGKIPLRIGSHASPTNGTLADEVGFIVDAKEDDYGLWIRGEFNNDVKSQNTRDAIKDGKVRSMSVQCKGIKVTPEGNTVVYNEAMLLEVTLTNYPLDAGAEIASVRTAIPAVEAVKTDTSALDLAAAKQRTADDRIRCEAYRVYISMYQ